MEMFAREYTFGVSRHWYTLVEAICVRANVCVCMHKCVCVCNCCEAEVRKCPVNVVNICVRENICLHVTACVYVDSDTCIYI